MKEIPASEITVLNSVKLEEFDNNNVIIFTSQEEFDEFQFNLPKTHPRSAPIVSLDFTTKNAAAIFMENLGAYQIERIEMKKNEGILILKPIEGYQSSQTSNLIVLEIPKEVQKLTLKK